ncbi:MAG: protein tyrosine phosphatase (PTP) superfamily phosphohydrolase (DUF442 family) [Oceanicoccus sp.]
MAGELIMSEVSSSKVFNFIRINDFFSTSGQPSKEEFKKIKDDGFDVVIDLAPVDYERYSIQDEPGVLNSLNLEYIHIPVDFKNPTSENYDEFELALRNFSGKKIWIHCAANYRVTVFFSIWAEKNLGWTKEESNQLIDEIWKSDPNWSMSEEWKNFIDEMRFTQIA